MISPERYGDSLEKALAEMVLVGGICHQQESSLESGRIRFTLAGEAPAEPRDPMLGKLREPPPFVNYNGKNQMRGYGGNIGSPKYRGQCGVTNRHA